MKMYSRDILKNLFLAGYAMRKGGKTELQAKRWFNKTYPIERRDITCPTCKSDDVMKWTGADSHGGFRLYNCQNCGNNWSVPVVKIDKNQ